MFGLNLRHLASSWQKHPTKILAVAALAALTAFYCLLLRPYIIGLWSDDAIYLIGSKALAMGQGYHLISEPGAPALIKYPPLLSAVMAPLWWLFPEPPANLPVFKGLMVGFDLAALLILYLFSRRFFYCSRMEASLLCLLTGVNHVWLKCMLDIMSEPLYVLLTLAALYYAYRLQVKSINNPSNKQLLALALLSGLVFYTRTSGLALIAAITLWLWKRYSRSVAFTYLGLGILLCLGWVWWIQAQPDLTQKVGHFYVVPQNQTYLMAVYLAILKAQGLVPVVLQAALVFPKALIYTLFPYSTQMPTISDTDTPLAAWLILLVLCGCFGFTFYKLVSSKKNSLLHGYLWFYLLLTLSWYSYGQYPRLLVCVLPLLYLSLFQFFRHLLSIWIKPVRFHQAASSLVIMLLVLVSLAFPGISKVARGNQMVKNGPQNLWADYQAAFLAIRQLTAPDDVLWSRYNGLYYIYTGRQVVNRDIIFSPQAATTMSQAQFARQFYDAFYTVLKQNQVRYFLVEPFMSTDMLIQTPELPSLTLTQAMPSRFRLVYTSPGGFIQLFQLMD